MKKHLLFTGIISMLLGSNSCNTPTTQKEPPTEHQNISNVADKAPEKAEPVVEQRKRISDFLPEGYVIFEKIEGDVNKDGLQDYILIIKGTDQKNVIQDEFRGVLDRNRRGIIVLLNKKDHYELAVKNEHCFSSENEDGGVYYAPELSVEVNKGNLYVHYGHGRYGYWSYTFRLGNAGFELIGYDASANSGPVVNSDVSINFLTKKKMERVNVNENADSEGEVFEETWKNISVQSLIKLADIKDFDELDCLIEKTKCP